MAHTKAFELDRLFEGSLRRLRTEAQYFSRLTHHGPELGRLNETHLVKLLRDYLPPKIGIGTGFIACGGDNPSQSPQCDIVLYDALNNAPLYRSDTWSIYPIEMVYGVIEVKTRLNRATLEDAFVKCAAIRAMAKTNNGKPNKAYIRQLPPEKKTPVKYDGYRSGLAPRFYVFGHDGWKNTSALEKSFIAISEKVGAHIHGVCNLYEGGSLYIRHQAFRKGADRFYPAATNGFRHFLMTLPTDLSSMPPFHRGGKWFRSNRLKSLRHLDCSNVTEIHSAASIPPRPCAPGSLAPRRGPVQHARAGSPHIA